MLRWLLPLMVAGLLIPGVVFAAKGGIPGPPNGGGTAVVDATPNPRYSTLLVAKLTDLKRNRIADVVNFTNLYCGGLRDPPKPIKNFLRDPRAIPSLQRLLKK